MRKHLVVLLAYLGLALLLTFPLVAHLTSHVPGDGIDDPSLAWNLWWVKHAFVDQPQNPFDCTWQFWPVGINLAFYTLTILNGMLSVPLQTAFNVITAYNILLLSSFVLGGFGAYLLCLDVLAPSRPSRLPSSGPSRLRDPDLAAFLAGALYAFASGKLFYAALGQGNIASSQWIPFAALYILRTARPGGRVRDAALAALFIVLQAYAELTYASFLIIFALVVAAWHLVKAVKDSGGQPKRQVSVRELLGPVSAVAKPQHIGPPGSVGSTSLSTTGQSGLTDRLQGSAAPGRLPIFNLQSSIFNLIARFALLAALFGIGIAPVLLNMLPDLAAEGDFFTAGGGFADLFSADLAGYALPTQLHPLLGDIVRGWSGRVAAGQTGAQFPVDKGQHIYVGYTALALAVIGVWHGRRRSATWFWVTATGLFFLLTLGPSLRIAGHDTGLPLPFRIMEQLPFFKGNRYPSRYSVMLLASLAPLVALGAAAVQRRFQAGLPSSAGRVLPLLLLPLLLFEHLSAPLPLFDLRVPALYQRVAEAPGDFALLELPLGWRNGARVAGKQDILIMQQLWYQSEHGKRLLGGNTSRNPEFKFQYFSEDPTLARLIALTNAADLPQHTALRDALAATPVTEADRTRARDWAAFLNIRYVMVHRDKLPPEAEQAAADLLPLALVAEDGPLALYALAGETPIPQTFTPATAQGRMILAEGWSPPPAAAVGETAEPVEVYAQRAEVRLLLPVPREEAILHLAGWSLAPDQRVTVVVDGRVAGVQPLPESPVALAFELPADPARTALSDVRLRFAATTSLHTWGQRLSAAGPVGLLVRSAGQETGDFAHIYVDGMEQAPGGRGYNLVALDGRDGTIFAAASFDTHADPAANAQLAQWVTALPADAWVAGAVRDEASLNLNDEGVAALRSLGVQADLRGHFRWGHAFIGRVGASATPATEMLDGWRVAEVGFRLRVSSPDVAAALGGVRIENRLIDK